MAHRWSLLGLLALAGCADEPAATAPWQARLDPLAGCAEAKAYVREVALAQMNRQVDVALAHYKRGELCWRGDIEVDASDASPPPTGPSTSTGTNNQVQGVDEADFVKNDGHYIYLAQNGVLRIVDAWPADQTHEVSKVTLPGTPKKLFVDGDKALVYVALGATGGGSECTYGYGCAFTGDGTQTRMMLFDISDRAAPRLERQVELAGSLIAARRIEDAVHTVVTQAGSAFETLRTVPAIDLCAHGSGPPPLPFRIIAEKAFDELRAANAKLIANADLDLRLHGMRDSLAPEVDASEAACAALFASPQQDGTAFTSIVSLDLHEPTPVTMSTIISRPGAIYTDADSLYMAVAHVSGKEERSTVHKFTLSGEPGETSYIGSGTVPGRALNQFAMDERDNFLRIATTIGHAPSPAAVSQLTVLAEEAGELVEVGKVSGIAPSEDIRSVRFDGTRAFVVTFKKTDPLFAFDLSN
ncbi:MAG TPA: beta-propeller domain-containing protein, partial [Kofleriaceae bacterium]|nr:beta-propeller domain-containing protein [Kofleriaceae bacterium]